ncbi:MAG: YicC family protein, partial [Kiritimatiellaeota bacterium]|nr:YicC family protein [Kiritimatiellota bacterium]
MSVRSMTGYGRGVAAAGGLRVEVRATSINRKQLDVQVNLAREFAELEPRLQAVLRAALSRGRVTLLVDVARSAAVRRQEVRVDE